MHAANAADSIIAHHIAKWDGGVWSNLRSGTNDSISVLAVDNDNNLYAGGGFDYAGSITGEHMYRITKAGLAPGAYIAQVNTGSTSMRWNAILSENNY